MEEQHPAGSYLRVVRRNLDGGSRNVELDFVRGLTILLVIGFHAMSPATQYAFFRGMEATVKAVGWSEVDLFFVLRGFLVGDVRGRLFPAKDRFHSLLVPPAVSLATEPVVIVPQPVSLTVEPSA